MGSYSHLEVDDLRNIDAIIYLAGSNRGKDDDILNGNIIPLYTLIRKLNEFQYRIPIIFASSLQVYGFDKIPIFHNENENCKPNSIYGISKSLAEILINNYSLITGCKSFILRISNVYGPGCRPFYNSVIATYQANIMRNAPIIISGSGNQARDFIYIDDVVSAFDKCLRNLDKTSEVSEILNICTGKLTSMNDLAYLMIEINGKDIPIQYDKKDLPDTYLSGDPTKAKKKIEFNANNSLIDGIKKIRSIGEVTK